MRSNKGFYVSMYGNGSSDTYRLVGPFSTFSAAEPYIVKTRAAARQVDVRAHFYLFNVAECPSDQPGILNAKILS